MSSDNLNMTTNLSWINWINKKLVAKNGVINLWGGVMDHLEGFYVDMFCFQELERNSPL